MADTAAPPPRTRSDAAADDVADAAAAVAIASAPSDLASFDSRAHLASFASDDACRDHTAGAAGDAADDAPRTRAALAAFRSHAADALHTLSHALPAQPSWVDESDRSAGARRKRALCRVAPAVVVACAAALVVTVVLERQHAIGGGDAPGAPRVDNSSGAPPGRTSQHVRQTTNFTYEGDTGPDFWGSLMPEFHACGDGRQQSPVDVAPAAVDSSWVEDSRPLQRRYAGSNLFNIVSRPAHPGFQVEPADLAALTAEWVVDGETFRLVQFHFHNPSEHTLHGFALAAEAHFVHRAASGRIAVFGIMFEEDAAPQAGGGSGGDAGGDAAAGGGGGGGGGNGGGTDNPLLAPFWDTIYKPTLNVTVDVGALVNDVQELYYRYNGSLTTPPCSEIVAWHVTMSRTPMSAGQVAELALAIGERNARPAQPLYGRSEVELYFGAGGATAATPWPFGVRRRGLRASAPRIGPTLRGGRERAR